MIDWINLAANALWISGCALALATLSYAGWEASFRHSTFLRRLRRPKYILALGMAGFLFSLGLAGTSKEIPELLTWGILAAGFIGLMALAYAQKRSEMRVMKK